MPIWKSRHCHWLALSLSVPAAFGTSTCALAQLVPEKLPVAEASSGAASAAQDDEQELYLEVTLNRVASDQLRRFVQRGGVLFASAETLREIGLKLSGNEGALSAGGGNATGLVDLKSLPGLGVAYDAGAQRLKLDAPVELLGRPIESIGAQFGERAVVDPATRAPGLVLNYDLYAQQTQGLRSFSAFSEVRAFGFDGGVWTNTMLSRSDGLASGKTDYTNTRLDTYWQRNFPDQAVTLTAGDVISGSLPWSRAARIGGLRLSRNFALQPYRITTPLASFAGSAVLPSTVELFVNGLKQSTQNVQPGQFQLSGVPSMGGSGQAQMVVTDITGRSRVVNFDLYGSPQLLEEGLADWSLDAGAIRRNYGQASFDYSGQLFSGSARYGLSKRTTLEAHAEAGSGVVQGGVGGVWLLGERLGLLSASAAASRQRQNDVAPGASNTGVQTSLGYQWNSRVYTLSVNTLRREAGFRDVASLPSDVMSRGSDSAYFGINSRVGQFGFSTVRQQYFSLPPVRYAGLSWSYALARNASLSLNINRNLDDSRGSSVYLSYTMPLDGNLTLSSTARAVGDSRSVAVDATKTPAGDSGGWGWRIQAALGDDSGAQGQVSHLGRYGQWMAGASQFGGQNGTPATRSVYGSASGGVVLMQGGLFASRRVDDAFALVSTSGVPNVPVRLENRIVGETDARGMLFVTQLNAYQTNHLSVDTLNLPLEMRISGSTIEAVPEGRSGMLASFGMRLMLAVQMTLQDHQGNPLQAGSQLWLDGANAAAGKGEPPETVVAFDGMVYLEDPPPGAVLRVETATGTCRVALPAALKSNGLLDLGVLTCQ